MQVLIPIILGLFGLIIGSFLNVVILRHNTGKSLKGKSGCLSCGAPLTPINLIPIFSWIIQRGRCSACGTHISIQYPLVELGTAILFALIGIAGLALLPTLLACTWAAFLVCIVVYDLRHTIIPNVWVYGSGLVALALRLVLVPVPVVSVDFLFTLLSGPVVAAPLVALWVATRGRGIGLADAKLALGAGWLLGMVYGLVAVMLSFVIGAAISLFVLLPLPYYRHTFSQWGVLQKAPPKSYTMKSEVPFGPFLVAGIFIVWFSILFGVKINEFLSLAFL